jgi:hypothetical protein
MQTLLEPRIVVFLRSQAQGEGERHRWRRRIESGQAKSITDLAEQEVVTDAYVCRVLPLTCLAPDIVEAILDGRQPKGLRLADVLDNGPLRRSQFGQPARYSRDACSFGRMRQPRCCSGTNSRSGGPV